MRIVTVDAYEDSSAALRHPDLAQALYDEGAVIMADTLLVLHGAEHRARRTLEMRVFRRDFFRFYETEVFPRTLEETIRPAIAAGRCDLMDLGYRVTMNLTADFAGIDRPARTPEETAGLLGLVMIFSEGATLVHSTRDREAVRAEVRAALAELEERFLAASIARRRARIERHQRGEIGEDALPRDVLTVLLRNEDKLDLPPEVLRREMAFYLQAGSHSTANSTTHALHDVLGWCDTHPGVREELVADRVLLQRFVHESLRLHPASPVAWRKPACPARVAGAGAVSPGDRVIVDMAKANREPAIFGADADQFNPHRALPTGIPPFGLSFGTGVHACLGRDLDGGVLPREGLDPAAHQLGIVPLFVHRLLGLGARLDPADPPERAAHTERPNFGRYPIVFDPELRSPSP